MHDAPRIILALMLAWLVGWIVWTIARPDVLRLVQGTHYVRARVVRHDFSRGDGHVPVFAFEHGGRQHEITGLFAGVTRKPEVGETRILIHPAKRPDLARPDQPFVRQVFYVGMAAAIAVFGDLAFGWF